MAPTVASARVGIVVPAYDAGGYLAHSLRSISAQTLTDWECVVVDDGSRDDTAAVARSFVDADARFRLVRQDNLGTPAARNAGLAALSDDVELIAFLDADDTWVPGALAELTAALHGHPGAVGAYGLAEYMDADGLPLYPGLHSSGQKARRRMGRFDLVDVPVDEPYTFDALLVSGTMWPSAVGLHRRSVIDRVGGFDASLRQVQDWDLYLRMSRLGPFIPVDRQVAWYRQHPSNVTKRSDRVAYYSLLVRNKAFESGDDTPAQHATARRVWRRLIARWTLWTAQAAVRDVRQGRRADGVAAAVAAARFVPTLVRGRPVEANQQMADTIARYVSDRAYRPGAQVAKASAR